MPYCCEQRKKYGIHPNSCPESLITASVRQWTNCSKSSGTVHTTQRRWKNEWKRWDTSHSRQ